MINLFNFGTKPKKNKIMIIIIMKNKKIIKLPKIPAIG